MCDLISWSSSLNLTLLEFPATVNGSPSSCTNQKCRSSHWFSSHPSSPLIVSFISCAFFQSNPYLSIFSLPRCYHYYHLYETIAIAHSCICIYSGPSPSPRIALPPIFPDYPYLKLLIGFPMYSEWRQDSLTWLMSPCMNCIPPRWSCPTCHCILSSGPWLFPGHMLTVFSHNLGFAYAHSQSFPRPSLPHIASIIPAYSLDLSSSITSLEELFLTYLKEKNTINTTVEFL